MLKFLCISIFSFIILTSCCVEANDENLKYQVDIGLNPAQLDDDSVNEWFDYLFANLREVISNTGIDPIDLPEDSDTFTATLFNTTMDGFIFVGDGKVSGLKTIHRGGNMSIAYMSNETESEVIVTGEAGLIGLEVSYSTIFELGPFKHHLGLTISISYISLGFETDVFIYPSTDIVLADCYIDELNTPHIHLGGMGLFDNRILNLLGNALLEILEPVLTEAISGVTCNLLQNALNGGATGPTN